MPKTKAQKIVFSLLMSLVMVYGMETYNHFIAGIVRPSAFTLPILELLGLMAAVIFLQETIGGRLARFIAFKLVNPRSDKKLKVIVTVQFFTVLIMCPMMSAVATIVFKGSVDSPFFIKWGLTVAANFPFALGWQLLVAGPSVRKVVSLVKV